MPVDKRESFVSSLPRSAVAFLVAVSANVVAMIGYAAVLISTGANASAYYLASVMLSSAFVLVYFSVSAIRSENTVELLAAICIGTCVTATIYYFRISDQAFSKVQRRGELTYGSSVDPFVIDIGVIMWQAFVQLALMVFGYRTYCEFGWRIFKIFGIDINLRQIYERFLWFMAVLKFDVLLATLNIAAGFAFFFKHLVGTIEYTLMAAGVVGNMLWLLCTFVAVKREYRLLTTTLIPLGLLEVAYLLYKVYDVYTVRTEGLAQHGDAYEGKYHDIWIEPIYSALCCGILCRLVLLSLMWQVGAFLGGGGGAWCLWADSRGGCAPDCATTHMLARVTGTC